MPESNILTYSVTPISVISALNTALEIDPLAINTMLSVMVPCSKELAESNYIEAMSISEDVYCTTTLGLLNALLFNSNGIDNCRIFAVYEDSKVVEFRLGMS